MVRAIDCPQNGARPNRVERQADPLRDILTVLAGLLILVLAAALVVPPFVEWEAHRERIELALAQAAGTPVKTEGRIELRLLPSPRVRLDQLRLGSGRADAPSLLANFVKAEIALTGLFQGDVRFTETRIGRAELRVPTAADGSWRLPPEIGSGEALGRRLGLRGPACAAASRHDGDADDRADRPVLRRERPRRGPDARRPLAARRRDRRACRSASRPASSGLTERWR